MVGAWGGEGKKKSPYFTTNLHPLLISGRTSVDEI